MKKTMQSKFKRKRELDAIVNEDNSAKVNEKTKRADAEFDEDDDDDEDNQQGPGDQISSTLRSMISGLTYNFVRYE